MAIPPDQNRLAGTTMPQIYSSKESEQFRLSQHADVRFPRLYRHLADEAQMCYLFRRLLRHIRAKDHWQIPLQAKELSKTLVM